MVSIPFVKKEQAELARLIEEKLLALPESSGILFVGVSVAPTIAGQDPVYRLLIGIDRELKVEEAIGYLAILALSEELLQGADIQTEVCRGSCRG